MKLRLLLFFLLALQLPLVALAESEKYAGISLGIMFAGSSDFEVNDSGVIYIGASNASQQITMPFSGKSEDSDIGVSWLASAYTGFAEDSCNLNFELELALMGYDSSLNDSDSLAFYTAALFVNTGYNSHGMDDYDLAFFGQVGLGLGAMYNIHGGYTVNGAISGQSFVLSGQYYGSSSAAVAAQGKLGMRYLSSARSSFSLALSVMYVSSVGSVYGEGLFNGQLVDRTAHGISVNDVSVLTGVIIFSMDMLVF